MPLRVLGGLVLAALAGCTAPRAGAPPPVGTAAGVELPPCPPSPNCVSSLAADPRHRVAPLPVRDGDGPGTLRRLRELLAATPRTRIVAASDAAVDAECRSRIFAFVDDLALRSDPAQGVIHVRSASRTGYWDLGVNRRRIEALRRALLTPAPPRP